MDETEQKESLKPTKSLDFSYFTTGEWIFFVLLVIAGILLRWMSLDYLPLHHDESIHAMFGQYFYDFPEIQYYKYDPEYHGPTLYMLLRPVYAALGSSDWSARSPIALLGSLAIFIPYIFRRYFMPTTVIFLTAAVSLSPSLVYWSRFVREDFIVFFGMFMMLYGVTLAKPGARSFFVLTGIALDWATKANIFVYLGIIAGFLIFELFYSRFVLKRDGSFIRSILEHVKHYKVQFVAGLLSAAFVFTYIITSGYRHLEAISNGLGLRGWQYILLKPFHAAGSPWFDKWKDAMRYDVLLYWLDKHNVERIQGPFNFHLYQLSWYELAFICAFFIHLVFFYMRAGKLIKTLAATTWAAAIGLFCYYRVSEGDLTQEAFWRFFKLKDGLDLLGLFLLFSHAFFVTCYHLYHRRYALAFFGYYFTASLFAYSYLGEKVPWLSSYPLTAGFIYLALYFESLWRETPLTNWSCYPVRKVLIYVGGLSFIFGLLFVFDDGIGKNAPYFVVGLTLPAIALADIYFGFLGTCNLKILSLLVLCIFNIRAAIITSFPGKDKELGYISQVHTTIEFRDLALHIRNNIEKEVFGSRPLVHVSGEASWPITWYFRGFPEYRFDNLTDDKRSQYAYIFDSWRDEGNQEVPEGFVARMVNLRGWWVPDFSQMTIKKFMNNAVNLEPWGGLGYSYARLLTNKKFLPAGVP